MSEEFINPNWHVILIHFPIGLLGVGLVVELLSILWPSGGFRSAGRWMLLLGALLSIPTALTGIYAFRDAVLPGAVSPELPWYEVTRRSDWSAQQWEFLQHHILFNASALVIFVLVTTVWLATTEVWRRRLYWPFLLLLLIGAGLLTAGAWHGGEAVYRFGTAVNPEGGISSPAAAVEPPSHAHEGQEGTAGQTHDHSHAHGAAGQSNKRGLSYYLPPLQLHLTLAGFMAAFSVGALALTIRRWRSPQLDTPFAYQEGSAHERVHQEPVARGLAEPGGFEWTAPPRRFWLAAVLLGVAAAVAGVWSVMGMFTAEAFRSNLQMLSEPSHRRLLWHVVFGVSILVLTLALGIPSRLAQRHRVLSGVLVTLLFLVIAVQVWLGILMLYDSHEGPLTGFANPPAAVTTRQ